jgi:hypothetical protein
MISPYWSTPHEASHWSDDDDDVEAESEEGRDEKKREGISTRDDVLLNPTDALVLRKEGRAAGRRRFVLTVELAPPWTRGLRPLLSPLTVGTRRVLKDFTGLALVNKQMPARSAK